MKDYSATGNRCRPDRTTSREPTSSSTVLKLPFVLIAVLLLSVVTLAGPAATHVLEDGRAPGDGHRPLDCTDADDDGFCLPEDCDDTNADVYPGAPEICDGLNNDCDHPNWPSLMGGWGEGAISTTADGAKSVFAIDVDGDNDVDVLSASLGDDKIAWYENTAGDGSVWTIHVISTAADGAESVFGADVDGDLDMDVLSASSNDDKIAWYENTAGDGSIWMEHVISTTADSARSVVATDVDGDLDMDVLSASYNGHRVVWYENTTGGGAAWTEHVISTSAYFVKSVFAADVDGDDDFDVLSAHTSPYTIVWYENTSGNGSAWTEHVISTASNNSDAVFAADVDGDLDMDALAATSNDGMIAWYENTAGDGSTWSARTITLTADGARSVFAADVDGDDDMDVLSTAANDDEIAWFENAAGDGSEWVERVISTTVDGTRSVFAADVDDDGDTDVLSASWNDDTIAWYKHGSLEEDDDGDGLAECEGDCDDLVVSCTTDCSDWDGDGVAGCAECDDADVSSYPGAPELCDGNDNACTGSVPDDEIDNDADGYVECSGWDDAQGDQPTILGGDDCDDANAEIYPGAPEICDGLSNDCSAPYWPLVRHFDTLVISTTVDGAESIFAADVDGDLDMDVLSASSGDDTIAWHENTAGDGSAWTAHAIWTTTGGARSVHGIDLDGDNDLDVLSAHWSDDKIAWYENTHGDGLFWTEHVVSTTADGALLAIAADVDGDEDLDILSASEGDNKIAWYENTAGDGSVWSEHVISTTAVGAQSVFAIDIDGDSDQDVLSASYWDKKIAWHENVVGDGSVWTEHAVTTTADGARSVFAADLDGDQDPDILSAVFKDDEIVWHENVNGDASVWAEHVIATTEDGARSVFAADWDDDDDMDVLSASEYGDKITWYENVGGDGSIWVEQFHKQVPGARSVFAADLDGDTDPDILSASHDVDTIAWYRNLSIEADDDGDGLSECEGDCDDTNPNCSTDCTDGDGDGYCATIDCDESDANCTNDCDDADNDGLRVCDGDCDDANDSVYPGAPQICDDLNNDCSDPYWPSTTRWERRAISTTADDVESVFAADVNGDGDTDILAATDNGDRIEWYENSTGDGSAWTQHEIPTNFDGAKSIFAVDVDGDLDIDVLSASYDDDRILWYENYLGNGSVWIEQVISTFGGAWSVFAADVDGDDDLDVLAASLTEDTIAWQENTLGDGSLWTEHVIPTTANGADSVFAADVDGDLDMDVLSSSYDDDTIAWYENTAGDGSVWIEHAVSTTTDHPIPALAADVDGDNDMDVVAASYVGGTVAWYGNTVGDGSVWHEHVISLADPASAYSVSAADLDGDGDTDLLSSWTGYRNYIAWHENAAGDGSLWLERLISGTVGSARSILVADVNGDDQPDPVSGAINSDGIAWHVPTSIEDGDGDGSLCSEDCDDSNPHCTTDCTDNDNDGYCLPEDCDETNPHCTSDCTDGDTDGYCLPEDCDDADDAKWSVPSEVWGLEFGSDDQTLSWNAPVEPGGTASPMYDTIRADAANGFLAGGTCIEWDDSADTQAVDGTDPASGAVFFYLIRAENACGQGSSGRESGGAERSVCACP